MESERSLYPGGSLCRRTTAVERYIGVYRNGQSGSPTRQRRVLSGVCRGSSGFRLVVCGLRWVFFGEEFLQHLDRTADAQQGFHAELSAAVRARAVSPGQSDPLSSGSPVAPAIVLASESLSKRGQTRCQSSWPDGDERKRPIRSRTAGNPGFDLHPTSFEEIDYGVVQCAG